MPCRLEHAWIVNENVIDNIWGKMMAIKPLTYVAQPGTASDVNMAPVPWFCQLSHPSWFDRSEGMNWRPRKEAKGTPVVSIDTSPTSFLIIRFQRTAQLLRNQYDETKCPAHWACQCADDIVPHRIIRSAYGACPIWPIHRSILVSGNRAHVSD